jgi:hypothetical protein
VVRIVFAIIHQSPLCHALTLLHSCHAGTSRKSCAIDKH